MAFYKRVKDEPMYTIKSDCFAKTFHAVKETNCERDAIRMYAYIKLAYPDSCTVLEYDGWIMSTKELSMLAKHLLG